MFGGNLNVRCISGLTNAFAAGAKMHGAAIIEDCPVETILVEKDARGHDVITGVKTKYGEVKKLLFLTSS